MTSSSSTICSNGTTTRPQSSTFLSSGSECSHSRPPSVIEQQSQSQQQQTQINTGSVASRPPSVSSERELHYASLGM